MGKALAIIGAGGGKDTGQQRAPIESPDSLRSIAYARILDLVSEGEIYGPADPDNPLSCVFYNETRLANADGTLNFKNVSVDMRYGTQTQDYIRGFPGVENEIITSVELTAATPWTQSITNLNLSAVRVRLSTPALTTQNVTNGDIRGGQIAYNIELSTDGGSFILVYRGYMVGKTTSKYERAHRIDLPAAATGWVVRVTRVTPDATSSAIQNTTFVEAFTEIIDAKFRMPMSAVIGTIIDAEQFNNIPSRAYHLKGRIIKVPSNYDPETRLYSGVWDGTFQVRYSNNPAWVFYDMVTNDRYGLGHLIDTTMIDKWALYEIAQYCDELVDDGFGGTEPRFTANLYLQSQNDALRVLQDMATMFRGIMYAAGGAIMSVADMPADPVYLYNQANVINGKFHYSGSAKKARHTVALVSWNDLTDMGRAKIEYVDDKEGILRYGLQPTETIAIGCTSRGQARRQGKYLLATERLDTQIVSFGVGMDGSVAPPGSIIEIADPLRAGRRMGGRVRLATLNDVTVDMVPEDLVVGDTIAVILPNASILKRTVSGVVGATISVSAPFDSVPLPHSAWIVESEMLATQKYRVLSVTERTGTESIGYNITALKHTEGKFAFVEDGEPIVEPPISDLGRDLPGKPVVTLTVQQRYGHGTAFNLVSADWPNVTGAVTYEIQWQKDAGAWSGSRRKSESNDEWEGAFAGKYRCRVWGINHFGITGQVGYSDVVEVDDAVMPIVDLEIVAGVLTIDCRFSQFRLNLDQNVTSVVFTNVAPQDTILIEVTQAAPGSHTINFGAGVQPVSGVAYVPTATVGAVDILGLTTNNSGVTWALVAQQPSEGGEGGGGPLSLTLSPSPASDTEVTDGITPVAPSVLITATPSGGTPPYTHAWTRGDVSGGTNFLISSAASDTPTFSIASGVTSYGPVTQTWIDTLTDNVGLTTQKTVSITLTRDAPQELTTTADGQVAEMYAVGTTGPTGGTVYFRVYRNGTWETWGSQTVNGTGFPGSTQASGNWITDANATIGDDYEVIYVPSGSGGTFTNGASAYSTINATRTATLQYTRSTGGSNTVTRTVDVTIREIANPSNSVTFTVTLEVTGDNS